MPTVVLFHAHAVKLVVMMPFPKPVVVVPVPHRVIKLSVLFDVEALAESLSEQFPNLLFWP